MPTPNLSQASQKLSQLGDYVFTLNTRQEDWIPFAAKSFAISIYYDIVMDNLIDYKGSITVGKEVASFQIDNQGHLIVYYTDGSYQDLGEVVGPAGNPGPAGRGIADVQIIAGDLWVTYTDATTVNVGSVVGPEGRGIVNTQIIDGDLYITYSDSPTPVNIGRVSGDRYQTTSTTSIAIPNHNDTVIISVETGLAYTVAQSVVVAHDINHYFTAEVLSYSDITGNFSLKCIKKNGSGTYASWQVNLAGAVGTNGDNGWSPVLAVVTDGSRRVFQVTNWVGGTGTMPTTGLYVGATGLTPNIASAVDVRGSAGAFDISTLINTPQYFEDFNAGRAAPGWTFVDAPGGTSIESVNVATYQGAIRIGTGLGGTGQGIGHSGLTSATLFFPGIEFNGITLDMLSRVSIFNQPTLAVNALVIIGFADTTAAATNAIVFQYSNVGGSILWTCRCTAGGVSTSIPVAVGVNPFVNYQLAIKATNAQVEFFIDNVLVQTIATNVPNTSAKFAPVIIARRTAGSGTNNALVVDYYNYRIQNTSRPSQNWPA